MTRGPTSQLGRLPVCGDGVVDREVLGQGLIVLPPCWLKKMSGSDYLNDLVEGG